MSIIYLYMLFFYKRVAQKLVDIEKKRSWMLERTGIKPSTWSSWEKNNRFPPADRALSIADTLGVSVEYLVSGKETPYDFRGKSPLVADISQRLLDMDDEKLRSVLSHMNALDIEGSP